jgi:phage shock protein A
MLAHTDELAHICCDQLEEASQELAAAGVALASVTGEVRSLADDLHTQHEQVLSLQVAHAHVLEQAELRLGPGWLGVDG